MRASILPLTASLLFTLGMPHAGPETAEKALSTLATPAQFTSEPTSEADPDWSADGKWIAFTSDRSGNNDLWIKPVDGGEALQVTTDPANDRVPRWSPDGTSLVFHSDRRGHWNLWTISPFEGEATATWITADVDSVASRVFPGSWSPDGTRVVIVSQRGGGTHLWIIPATGGEAQQLTTGRQADWDPDWSPDGQWIVYSSAPSPGPGASIWIVPSEGGAARQMTTDLAGDFNPSWSPDGKWIAVTSEHRSAGWDLWMLPATGGVPAQITATEDEDEFGPRWSPDGTRIAFNRRYGSGTADIWMAEVKQIAAAAQQMPRQRFAGQVRRPNSGTGWAEVPIYVRDDDNNLVQEARTAADGRYQVFAAPGSYLVSAGLHDTELSVEITLGAGQRIDDVDFVPELATIAGRITFPKLRSRRWVRVRAEDVEGNIRAEQTTGEERGHYQLWVAPGSYRVSLFDTEGAEPVEVTLQAGEGREDIDFSPTRLGSERSPWKAILVLFALGMVALLTVIPVRKRRAHPLGPVGDVVGAGCFVVSVGAAFAAGGAIAGSMGDAMVLGLLIEGLLGGGMIAYGLGLKIVPSAAAVGFGFLLGVFIAFFTALTGFPFILFLPSTSPTIMFVDRLCQSLIPVGATGGLLGGLLFGYCVPIRRGPLVMGLVGAVAFGVGFTLGGGRFFDGIVYWNAFAIPSSWIGPLQQLVQGLVGGALFAGGLVFLLRRNA